MNQWVRDALAFSGMSQQALADALSRHPGLNNYDRSFVYKMTVSRRVRLDEAAAISEITGFPLPVEDEKAEFERKFNQLSLQNQQTVAALIEGLLGAQEEKK